MSNTTMTIAGALLQINAKSHASWKRRMIAVRIILGVMQITVLAGCYLLYSRW